MKNGKVKNQKIWALAKDENDKYELKEDGNSLKYFHIDNVIKKRTFYRKDFDKMTFWSTNDLEKDRVQLIPVNLGQTKFFRYFNPSIINGNGSNGESYTHLFIIEYLSRQEVLPFKIDNRIYHFKVIECKADYQTRFQFGENEYYFPDLYIKFSEPLYFVKKWGGKVIVEVRVSNKVNDKKRIDFEKHNIPIIEINVSKDVFYTYDDVNEKKEMQYVQKLDEFYKECIEAKVITYNVETSLFRNEQKKEHSLKRIELEKQLAELAQRNDNLVKDNLSLKNISSEYEKLKCEYTYLNQEIQQLKDTLNSFNDRSLLQKLKDLFL